MKTIRKLIDKCGDLAESGEIDGSILPNLDDCEEEFRLAKIKLKKLLISDVVKTFTSNEVTELIKKEKEIDFAKLFFKLQK